MAKGRKQLNILISQKIMIYEDIKLTPFTNDGEVEGGCGRHWHAHGVSRAPGDHGAGAQRSRAERGAGGNLH